MSKTYVCETCGAAVTSDRCDLCGTPVKAQEFEEPRTTPAAEVATPTPTDVTVEVPPARTDGNVVCPTCGAGNRGDARFCDQCGEQFDEPAAVAVVKAPPVPKATKQKVKKAPKKQPDAQPKVGLYVAGAIAAVVILYLLSVWTGGESTPPATATSGTTTPAQATTGGDLDDYLPEDAGLESSLADTRAAIESATDPGEKQARREELVQAYAGAGRLDLAGREQEALAAELNSAEAWAMAGNLHFDWMEAQSGPERVKSAQRAARAYEKSLAIDESSLDVRTDLGVAYLNDPSSPMLAIQNTNMVLAADSNHVQANFNKGVMLAQIGRRDEAIRLFHKVTSLSAPGEPAHERAKQILDQLGASAVPANGEE